MRSACLDEYQHAVGWHCDLFLLGRNRWILVLTQGFFDLLLDFQQGCVHRGGLCGDFGEVRNMGGTAVCREGAEYRIRLVLNRDVVLHPEQIVHLVHFVPLVFVHAKTPDETKICAVLTADIDLNNEEWTPIGPSESSAYTGTFDGQGHTVRNLSITGDVKRAGLFGCVIGGAIRKLTVAGSVSCTVDQGWCGGIAGYAERETIENCASLCTVSYTGKDARVGGIVGYVPSSSSMTIICDCYNIGNITGSSDTGGICGYNLSGRIFNCYNVGEITGGNYVSKIVGYGQANNNPTNCYYLSDTDTDPAAKTAAEFADRTVVLKLLKAGRNDSPWDSCQYVATAGITLPVFNGQGDAHNANGGRQEQLRVTKQLFVVSELLVGQAAKFLPGKTANKKIARDNIIILKGTVQRQTIHLARIVADKRHIVL